MPRTVGSERPQRESLDHPLCRSYCSSSSADICGPRDSIVSYMTKQSLPAVSTVTSTTLEEFKTADKVVVVAYFDAKDKKSNETFTGIADSLRESLLFGATHDADLAKSEGVKQPGIVLYKQFDAGKDSFEDKFTTENIERFINTAKVPLVGELTPETYADYMKVREPATSQCGTEA